MTGRLDLTPYAREAIGPDEAAALRKRVPDGHKLYVSGGPRSTFRRWTVSLVGSQGLIGETRGPDLDNVITTTLSYLRCSACGKRLTDWGECDSCTFDRSEEARHA